MRDLSTLFRRTSLALAVASVLAPSGAWAQDCAAQAGHITTDYGPICLEQGQATLVGVPAGDAVVPEGFSTAYLLTRTNALIVDQVGATPEFTVGSVDIWRIHTLVYDANTLDLSTVVAGTYAYDLQDQLVQGGGEVCASLDISGAPVKTGECPVPCTAKAAGMVADIGPVCLVDGEATLVATPAGPDLVPPGYEIIYVLTRTNGLIIEQTAPTPEFTVNSVDIWRIHALIYEPSTLDLGLVEFGVTSAYDIQSLLVQGGGEICASLDISGAPIKTGDCPPPCTAKASGMIADIGPVCLVGGEATLTAAPQGPDLVPPGYATTYVLTRTNGLIIEQTGPTPEFTVTTEDVWRIHALVYDPATLDLSTIEFGVTSAYDVQALLVQGGGQICASLDISGAPIKTAFCEKNCTADAGTLTADDAELCLQKGQAVLSATANGDAVVPDGYSVIHLLTEGAGLVIMDVNTLPTFTVTAPGLYTLHTLVYDPATLDLSMIELGTTTGFEVNGLLLQGGGGICGSLDVEGAGVQVTLCSEQCTADAGTITATEPEVCLVNGQAHLVAMPNGDNSIPPGFVMAYVLTQGPELVIRNVEPVPEFEWPFTGDYAIHGFVYDPNTFSIFTDIQLDVTTGFEVNAMLTAGGGPICGSLDVLGAPISVVECDPPLCDAGGSVDVSVCETDLPFILYGALSGAPCPGGTWTSPSGEPIDALFVPGIDPAGVYTYFVQMTNGQLDTSTVTVQMVPCPEEFGANAQLQGAGPVPNLGVDEAARVPALSAWPNPATDMVRISVPHVLSPGARVDLFDATGRQTVAPASILSGGLLLDVNGLSPGTWSVRVSDGGYIGTARFIRSAQ